MSALRPSARALLPPLLGLLSAPASAQLAWELTPLAHFPGEARHRQESGPILGNGGTAYWHELTASGGSGGSALYAQPGGLLASDPRTDAEEGDYPSGIPTDAAGGTVLLHGDYLSPSGAGFQKKTAGYVFPGFARIAYFLDAFPGFNQTVQVLPPFLYDGTGGVIFAIRQQTGVGVFRRAIVRAHGGTMTVLVESGVTAVPGAGGATFDVLWNFSASDGVVLFHGEGGGRRGIYEWSAGTISTVVDDQTVLPPNVVPVYILPQSKLSFANDGRDVAVALPELDGGVWKRVAGTWSQVVPLNAPIPGGEGALWEVFVPSIHDGVVAFFGARRNQFAPPRQVGLYTDLGGTLHPIANLESDFGGNAPTDLDVAEAGRWFDGTEAVFAAESSAFRTLYRATPVPEPASTEAAVVAALAALARRRSRRPRSRSRSS